jgi:hypothetical protein
MMVVDLQEQLLAWERELDSREGTITVWKDSLAASERALGRVCMECVAECNRAEAVRQDYQARILAFMVVVEVPLTLTEL